MLLLWMLAVYGIADTVSKARVGAPLRRRFPLPDGANGPGPDDLAVTFAHLIRCPKCVGWWVSALLTLLHMGPAEALSALGGGSIVALAVRAVLNGFAGAAVCWFVYVVLHKLGADDL